MTPNFPFIPEIAWGLIAALILLLVSVIGWFLRKDYKALEDSLRSIRESDVKNQLDARAKDRHDLRDEISTDRALIYKLELRMEREFVNVQRMREALAPLKEVIEAMQRDQRELFNRLYGKQDKPSGD